MKKRMAWLVVVAMMGGSSILLADPASVVRLSGAFGSDEVGAPSTIASVSPEGGFIGFSSLSDELSAADVNGVGDVYLHDVAAEAVVLVSANAAGTVGNNASDYPAVAREGRFVAFSSMANNLVTGDTNGVQDVFVKDMATGLVERISVASDGSQADGLSRYPSISADGNLVAFDSQATNLVAGDENGESDVFVHNRKTGKTWRVSVSDAGVEGDDSSGFPRLSGDGGWVAFESRATNLVDGDTNGVQDLFLRPVSRSGIERISVSAAGAESNGDSFSPSLSPDGRYVAFDSDATNLVGGDTNGQYDVFVLDRVEGTLERVSVSSAGAEGNGDSYNAAVTDEGDAYFQSWASNLVTGDTNAAWDIFFHNWVGTTIISVTPDGGEGDGSSERPATSDDGLLVAYHSAATDLVVGDTNGVRDVFFQNRLVGGGGTKRASVTSAVAMDGNGASTLASISGNGRRVAFESSSTNLIAGDTNAAPDIFMLDRQTGELERVSLDRNGGQANGTSANPRITADGGEVVFESLATNLVVGDTNGQRDIFLKQIVNGMVYRVLGDGDVQPDDACFSPVAGDNREVAFYSAATNLVAGDTNGVADVFYANVLDSDLIERVSVSTAGVEGNGASAFPAMTPDGRYVAFISAATTLVLADTNGANDVFVRDRTLGTTERVSINAAGMEGNGHCWAPDISDDGRYVAFASAASNLVTGDSNVAVDIFVYDREEGTIVRASVNSSGTQGNASSSDPRLSDDGRHVAFLSAATNLVTGDTNGRTDVFVHDLGSGDTAMMSMDETGNLAAQNSLSLDISGGGRHVVFSNADGLVDQDANGLEDVFLAWNGFAALVPGMAFSLAEGQVAGFTDPVFTRKPKVVGAYTDPVKFTAKRKTAKVLTSFSGGGVPVGGGVDCAWNGKVKLFDSKAWKNEFCRDMLQADGDLAADAELLVGATLADGTRLVDAAAGGKILAPPEIAWIVDIHTGDPVLVAEPGQECWITGAFFGNKAPKVWLEYTDAKGKFKQAKCKVQANRYFADAAGKPNKSCMDPASGFSQINVLLPARWPKGWMPGRHDLVIDNGCGRACFRILTE